MVTQKKTRSRKPAAKKTTARSIARRTGEVLKEKWDATVKSLASAEAEVEKQLKAFVKKNKLGTDAAKTFKELRGRLYRERKKAVKELESRVAALQARIQKERKSLTRLIDDAVRGALVALNIPSRQEIVGLTRKVDELSRKIDSVRGDSLGKPAVPRKLPVPPSAGL